MRLMYRWAYEWTHDLPGVWYCGPPVKLLHFFDNEAHEWRRVEDEPMPSQTALDERRAATRRPA